MQFRHLWGVLLLLNLCAALGACAALGQTCKAPDQTEPIATDRPSFTNASTTVPCRTLQLENGFNETAVLGRRAWDLPQSMVRFGAASRTELRFALPDRYWNTEAGSSFASGAGDLAVGVKQQLGPVRGFDVAAIAALSLPSGSEPISSHGHDASLQLPWSRKLSGTWTAAGMFSISWPTENGEHVATGLATALLDRQLAKPWDAFAEYAGTFPGRGGPQHIADFGLIYKLTRNQQIDVRGGAGLSANAVEHFVGAGYSFRFNLY